MLQALFTLYVVKSTLSPPNLFLQQQKVTGQIDLLNAWVIRHISAILNSIQQIKFERNPASESAAAFLPLIHLVTMHHPTEMQHRLCGSRIYPYPPPPMDGS